MRVSVGPRPLQCLQPPVTRTRNRVNLCRATSTVQKEQAGSREEQQQELEKTVTSALAHHCGLAADKLPQGFRVVSSELGGLPSARVVHASTCHDGRLVLSCAVSASGADAGKLQGLMAHWGCAPSPSGRWFPPPAGWVSHPPISSDAGGGAWQTQFEHPGGDSAVSAMVLVVPINDALRNGGISFVLKTSSGMWLQRQQPNAGGRENFFAAVQTSGVQASASPGATRQEVQPRSQDGPAATPGAAPQNAASATVRQNLSQDAAQQDSGRVVTSGPAPAARAVTPGHIAPDQDVTKGHVPKPPPKQPAPPPKSAPLAPIKAPPPMPSAVRELLDTFQWRLEDGVELQASLAQGAEQADLAALVAPAVASVSASFVQEIAGEEHGAERSLMHRYDTATKLLTKVLQGSGDAQDSGRAYADLASLTMWLRFSAARHLTWNRNYNIKPREISAAQDRLNTLLSRAFTERPALRDLLLSCMSATGRGGHGDVGQRIRDEILAVQARNHCKGGMMEEWHQKLHNNTSPDDVDICCALLDYCAAGCDITAYWKTLNAAGITAQRLASYDRAIRSEPRFEPHQVPGLVRDLTAYLKTLRAVHSGADLASAAANVLGYSETDMKGKTVTVPPLEPVAALPQLPTLLAAVQYLQEHGGAPYIPPPVDQDHSAGKNMLASVEEVLQGELAAPQVVMAIGDSEVQAASDHSLQSSLQLLQLVVVARRKLAPAIKKGDAACGGRLRDVLFLDMSLDSTLRTALEGGLVALRAAAQPLMSDDKQPAAAAARAVLLSRLLQLLAVVVECVALSSNEPGMRQDLGQCLKWFGMLGSMTQPELQRDRMLQALAVIDRLKRCLSDNAQGLMAALQPHADAVGAALKIDPAAPTLVVEGMARGSSAAPLAQLLSILEPVLRKATGSGDWQIISRGLEKGIVGRLRVEPSLSAVQYEVCVEPTVLVIQQLTGHEEIPEGAVAVLVGGTVPDILSHSAVRARNMNVLLAGCYNDEVMAGVLNMAGDIVELSAVGQNIAVKRV